MTAIPQALPSLSPPAAALDTEQVTVRLRLTHRRTFPFLHGGVIHGLLCRVFGHELPAGLLPWVPESGRVGYEAGDGYVFALTVPRLGHDLVRAIEPRLHEIAAQRWRRAAGATLSGNFLVEEVAPSVGHREVVGAAPDGDELEAFAQSTEPVRLRFLSPLRLKRPRELKRAGAGFLDRECFPADHFLRRLYQRWHLVHHGAYPQASEIPEPPADAAARPGHLVWIDLPVVGAQDGKRMTIGGVMGDVELSGLTPPWRRLVASMQRLHAGASTHYGLGRYVLDEGSASLVGASVEAPARSHLEQLATGRHLARAADCEARRGRAGVDGVTPRAFLAGGAARLDHLATELRTGRYCPDPLRLVDGQALATVRDRIVQRALVEQLREPARALRTLRRRAGQGGEAVTVEDLVALLPMEPAVQLLRSFAEVPVYANGRRGERACEVEVVSPLRELFRAPP
ncbi:MAG: CRISPR system precrRNA processing endoribonuclease RAMP protein Cas6 [Acidobacteriota bacterium]